MTVITPLIIKSDIDTLLNIYISKDFIYKVFDISNTNNVVYNNNKNINILKIYTIQDLEKMFTINQYIKENIIPKINDIKIELNINLEVIEHSEKLLIIKYICSIDNPKYVKNMLADQSTVFYVKIYPKKNKEEYLIVNYIRKFIPSGDDEINNDSDAYEESNILNDNYKLIQFNPGLLMAASAILGNETVNDVIIPFIYKIFDEFVDNILNKKIKKYLKKKNIDVYIKKDKK